MLAIVSRSTFILSVPAIARWNMAIGASACSRIFNSVATFWQIAFTCLYLSLKSRADFTRRERLVPAVSEPQNDRRWMMVLLMPISVASVGCAHLAK